MEITEPFYRAAERRIEWLTLALGTLAGLGAAVRWGWRSAAGVALGALLSWMNYRWLKQGIDALAWLAGEHAETTKGRVPLRVYAKFFGRFVLLLAVLYVILSGSWLPAAAVLGGLFTLVAAVLGELLYELARGWRQPESKGS